MCPHFLPGPLRTSAFSTCLQAWVSSTVLCAAPQGHGVQLPPPSLPASSRCWSWSCWSQSFPAPDKRSQRPWHSSPPLCACQALLVSRLAIVSVLNFCLPGNTFETFEHPRSPGQNSRIRGGGGGDFLREFEDEYQVCVNISMPVCVYYCVCLLLQYLCE